MKKLKLSKRQQQLLQCLNRGLTNAEIASEVEIADPTVKVHMWRLFKKIGVKNRLSALRVARQNGLLVYDDPTDKELIAIGQAALKHTPGLTIDIDYARAVIAAMRLRELG